MYKNKLILIIILFIISCNIIYCNDKYQKIRENKTYINGAVVSDEIISEMFESLMVTNEIGTKLTIDLDKLDDFHFGVPVLRFSSYENRDIAFMNREFSILTNEQNSIKFLGFSDDSENFLYKVDNIIYEINLYEEYQKTEYLGDINNIKEFIYENKSANMYYRNNKFWFKIGQYQAGNGFDITLYSTEFNRELVVFSKNIRNMVRTSGNIEKFEVYFSNNSEWVAINLYFDGDIYNYGFIVINIRKHYANLLRREAINNYRDMHYETAVLRYRQSIYLDGSQRGISGMFYDCAYLLYNMNKSEFIYFINKAIKLNPDYKAKAKVDNIIY